jgi:HlyD family secretion protein
MRIKGLILPIVATACLAYAAISIMKSQPQQVLNEPPQPPPRSDFENTIAAVGLTEPSSESINIGSHLSGVVTEVLVKAGDKISKDQALFIVDHRALDAQRSIAQARIRQAAADANVTQALLDQARRRLDSVKSLSDQRAIAAEELADRASEVVRLEASLASAKATTAHAEAELEAVISDIFRSTITSPIEGSVLQVRIRKGEFIQGGSADGPRLIVGQIDPLFLRANIDEFEIARLKKDANATASPRGNSAKKYALRFVRYEPLVIPKQSLTGDSTERVDTRVLQAIYQVLQPDEQLFVGQQMDVFMEALPHQSD